MHISDLHRSPKDPISNATLIQSLLADKENYATYGVKAPNAIVVSGDLIWGASIGARNYGTTIRNQYEVAIDFLSDLTERFLDGDRSRVVIAPGNHDCCWNTAFAAMRRMTIDEEPAHVQSELRSTSTRYRWSWQDRSLYEVADEETYQRRFDAYWDSVEDFYRDADLATPLSRHRTFNVFELDAGRVVFVAFESQRQNDHLADYGYISDDSIAKCDVFFRDRGLNPKLKVGVWHHGIAGPPVTSDYLDVTSVSKMVATGFRLGLHGHQHYAGTSTQYVHLPETEKMAVVGAGSLCAGETDLPHAVNRQYNLIVVYDTYDRAAVYVREVISANQFGPSHHPSFGPDGRINIEWGTLKDMAGRPIDHEAANLQRDVLRAEQAINEGCPESAIGILARLDLRSFPRALYIKAAQAANRHDLLADILELPENADELVTLVFALAKANGASAALAALHDHQQRVSLLPSVAKELEQRLEFQKTVMRG